MKIYINIKFQTRQLRGSNIIMHRKMCIHAHFSVHNWSLAVKINKVYQIFWT